MGVGSVRDLVAGVPVIGGSKTARSNPLLQLFHFEFLHLDFFFDFQFVFHSSFTFSFGFQWFLLTVGQWSMMFPRGLPAVFGPSGTALPSGFAVPSGLAV